jgi:cytochrome c-type biogenesis protein CcmH
LPLVSGHGFSRAAAVKQCAALAAEEKLLTRFTIRKSLQVAALSIAVVALMGAGDESARFNRLGHEMMCVCGCSQILLECNHVGCQYSDRMRGELLAALDRGDADSLILQGFIQKYGTTVIAAPTTTGFSIVAWIMPFLALALGLLATVLIVRAWRSRPAPLAPGGVLPVSGSELDTFRKKAQEDTEI